MLLDLIVSFVAMFVTPDAARGLSSTAPAYLDEDSARQHLAAAVVAGVVTGEDSSVLLAIARGESNYRVDVLMVERSGALSCGVMQATAINRDDCTRLRSSLLAGYLAGARQLRAWRTHARCRGNLAYGLAGYAGGWRMVELCSKGAGHAACWRAVGARLRLAAAIRGPGPTS